MVYLSFGNESMGSSTQDRIPECVVPLKKSLLSRNIHFSSQPWPESMDQKASKGRWKWITASMVITITCLYNTPLDQWFCSNWARTCSNNAWAMGGLWDCCSCDQRPGSRQLSECRRQANWQAGRSKCVCHMVFRNDNMCHYLVGLLNCISILQCLDGCGVFHAFWHVPITWTCNGPRPGPFIQISAKFCVMSYNYHMITVYNIEIYICILFLCVLGVYFFVLVFLFHT